MKKWRERLSSESGLTLVELLAGLFLFGLALSMLYGVLMSGYSLKDKVTRQATLNNFADLLVNEIMLSLKNADEVTDVKDRFPDLPGALWTTQYENRGTKQQKRVYYLYLITDEGVPAGMDVNGNPVTHYKLIREKYELPPGKTFLELEHTSHFTSGGVEATEILQLNDERFPLLNPSTFDVYYDQTFDIQDSIGLTLTICRYEPDKTVQTDSAAFTFQSQININ
jgi:hypothetical protein